MVISVNGSPVVLNVDNILLWCLVGLVAGFLASHVALGHGLGLIWDIVVGIIGAFFQEAQSTLTYILLPFIGAPLIEEALKPSGIYLALLWWPRALRSQLLTALFCALSGLPFGSPVSGGGCPAPVIRALASAELNCCGGAVASPDSTVNKEAGFWRGIRRSSSAAGSSSRLRKPKYSRNSGVVP